MRLLRVLEIAVLCALAATALAVRPKWHELEGYSFDQYVKDFGKPYERAHPEYRYRRELFEARLESVKAHNADSTQTYRRGVNMYSDMSRAEWKAFNTYKKNPNRGKPTEFFTADAVMATASQTPLPIEVDWRTATSPRVLTAVKHQGSCGNCWAHSAAETLEAHYALITGKLPVLSTQMITSCAPNPCQGCQGCDATSAFQYVNSTTHGLTEEWAYPFSDFYYNFTDPTAPTAACYNVSSKYPNKKPYSWFAELTRVGTSGWGVVDMNATAAMSFLATRGPLSIAVAAGNWQDYETGIFSNTNKTGADNEWSVDHAVQMVGYGFDKYLNKAYWIVRNSWSTQWGEDGFIKLERPAVEPCSPDSYGPVCGTSGCLSDLQFPIVWARPNTPF